MKRGPRTSVYQPTLFVCLGVLLLAGAFLVGASGWTATYELLGVSVQSSAGMAGVFLLVAGSVGLALASSDLSAPRLELATAQGLPLLSFMLLAPLLWAIVWWVGGGTGVLTRHWPLSVAVGLFVGVVAVAAATATVLRLVPVTLDLLVLSAIVTFAVWLFVILPRAGLYSGRPDLFIRFDVVLAVMTMIGYGLGWQVDAESGYP